MSSIVDSFVRVWFRRKKGMFRVYHGVATQVEPADVTAYRELLPAQFEMPRQPVVHLFVVNYTRVVPWPMIPYLEGAVVLKARLGDQDTWHVVTMPVTEQFPMQGGRDMGFPKYVADQITLESIQGGWRGEVRHAGVSELSLEFQSGLERELLPWEAEIWEGGEFFADAVHQLLPPAEGPTVLRIGVVHQVPPDCSFELGMVRIGLNPGSPWGQLVPAGAVGTGVFCRFKGGTSLVPTVSGG